MESTAKTHGLFFPENRMKTSRSLLLRRRVSSKLMVLGKPVLSSSLCGPPSYMDPALLDGPWGSQRSLTHFFPLELPAPSLMLSVEGAIVTNSLDNGIGEGGARVCY